MTARAADDIDAISARLTELRAQRLAAQTQSAATCMCVLVIKSGWQLLLSDECPTHRVIEMPAANELLEIFGEFAPPGALLPGDGG